MENEKQKLPSKEGHGSVIQRQILRQILESCKDAELTSMNFMIQIQQRGSRTNWHKLGKARNI